MKLKIREFTSVQYSEKHFDCFFICKKYILTSPFSFCVFSDKLNNETQINDYLKKEESKLKDQEKDLLKQKFKIEALKKAK